MSFSTTFDLTTLNATTGLVLTGGVLQAKAGLAVASAGDMNGDGFDDLVIGAVTAPGLNPYAGAAYVVFGTDSGFPAVLNLSTLNGVDGFAVLGSVTFGSFAFSVDGGGDFNGDGLSDIVVGDQSSHHPGSQGSAFVIFGSTNPWPASLDSTTVAGVGGIRRDGPIFSQTGFSVSVVGDINGDGIDDISVGAPMVNGRLGAVYVVFGSNGGLSPTADLADLDGTDGFSVTASVVYGGLGYSISGGGDFNGDGIADLMVAGVDQRAVVFGSASGFPAALAINDLDGSNGFRLTGLSSDPDVSIKAAGDINGDGLADLIVGTPLATIPPYGFSAGIAYVVFGRSTGVGASLNVNGLDGETGFKILGGLSTGTGRSVSGAGDVNGDGLDDLLIGAPNTVFNYYPSGSAVVVFGRGSGFADTLTTGSLRRGDGFTIIGSQPYDQLAYSVAAAGDLNGDGLDDLAIGSPFSDIIAEVAGSVHVIFGQGADWTGGAGDDSRVGDSDDETFHGGLGKDSLSGGDGADILRGDDGNDVLDGGAADDFLFGGQGSDILVGGDGADDLSEVAGANKLFGNAGDDRLTGGTGADRLDGGADNDDINGRAGNDYLDGGSGTNRLRGGTGNDVYFIRSIADTVIEAAGEGTDTVRATFSHTLADNCEALELQGGAGINGVGNAVANTIKGNNAANTLSGLAGADRLNGGAGADTLIGGLGRDQLNGGTGADTFRVLQESISQPILEIDTVQDYEIGVDLLDFSQIDANSLVSGDQAFTVSTTGLNRVAGQLYVFYTAAQDATTLRLDVNGDGRADYQMTIKGNVVADTGGWLL